VSFQIASRKVVFLRQFFQAFCLFFKEQTRCPKKNYDSPRGLCTGQICDFPRVIDLLRIQARLLITVRLGFFLICSASREPKTSYTTSVIIRAAKLKFVAQSRTGVYFALHVKLPQLASVYFAAS